VTEIWENGTYDEPYRGDGTWTASREELVLTPDFAQSRKYLINRYKKGRCHSTNAFGLRYTVRRR
jgi:hypothetical protein